MARFSVILCLLYAGLLSADTAKITVGVLPGGNPQAIEKESFTLAEKMQDRLGRAVQIYISKDYAGMIEAIKARKVDLAVLSSMTYVMAEDQANLKVLLKKTWSNGPFYYSAILARNGSGIKSVKGLKGKKVAFVDEKSTSGYLYPQVYLKKQGLSDASFKSVTFSGNHAASVEMLEKGQVDAIAVFADDEKGRINAWTRFAKAKSGGVKALWVSEPIPNDPIVVRQDFYDRDAKLTHEIMYTLIEIQSEAGQSLSEVLGSSDLMPATARQYDPVREMVKTFQKVLKL